MSQLRVMLQEIRAALAAAVTCALILGLVFSNVAQAAGSHSFAPGAAKTGGYALCLQHLAHPDKHAAPASGDERSSQHKCPGCCLAATLGAALIPERFVHATKPATVRPVRVAYIAASPRAPESLLFRAANGARAPPV